MVEMSSEQRYSGSSSNNNNISSITVTEKEEEEEEKNSKSDIVVEEDATNLLFSLALSNSYIYFGVHSHVRRILQHRMNMSTYDIPNATYLISEVYIPEILKELTNTDKDKVKSRNIDVRFQDITINKYNRTKYGIPAVANKLSKNVRSNLAVKLRFWLEGECRSILKDQAEYNAMITTRTNNIWKYRKRHQNKREKYYREQEQKQQKQQHQQS